MVLRRFRGTPIQSGLAQRALAQARARASSMQGRPLAARAQAAMRPGQAAIDFGRSMTASPVEGRVNAIKSQVGAQLGAKGIYQDERGNWKIAGLEMPTDLGIDIRDSAINARDPSGAWMQLVRSAEQRMADQNRFPGAATNGSVRGGGDVAVPSPGLGGVPSREGISAATGGVRPTTRTPPVVTSPPAVSTPAPAGATRQGTAPLIPTGAAARPGAAPVATPVVPGTGALQPRPAPAVAPDIQGGDSGRIGSGSGGQVIGSAIGSTTPQIAGQSVSDPLGGRVQGDWQPGRSGQPPLPTTPSGGPRPSTQAEVAQGGLQRFDSGGLDVIGTGSGQPPRVPPGTGDPLQQPGSPSSFQGYQSLDVVGNQSGQPIKVPPGTGDPLQQPANPSTLQGFTRRGTTPAQTPAAAGPVTTSVVPPGVTPGVSTSGGTPDGAFAPPAGLAGLAGLGDRIQSGVEQRLAGLGVGGDRAVPSAQDLIAQNPAMQGLSGLGDRIRAATQRNPAQIGTGQPAGGPSSLGDMAQSIVATVQNRLQQGGAMDTQTGTTPVAGQPTGGPTTGTTGQPTGGPTTAAPAPAPTSPMPTGTGSLGTMGGKYAPLDQYNPIFEAAGAEFGVPPELLKAMAGIESGWTGDPSLCRDDGLGDGASCGIMQVKGGIHQEAGCTNQNDPTCNIRTAAAILKGGYDACGNWDCAITSVYFTQDDSNGTTQGGYLDVVHQSMQEQAANPGTGQGQAQPGATPVGGVGAPQIDPNTGIVVTGAGTGGTTPGVAPGAAPSPASAGIIANPTAGGGVYNTISQPSGQAVPNGQPIGTMDAQSTGWADALTAGGSQAALGLNYGYGAQGDALYGGYGPGWGCATCHPGADVPTNGSQPFNSLQGGTVTCIGNQSALGSGGAVPDGSVACGAYNDDAGGTGNVSVLAPNGALIVYGHTRSTTLTLGGQVQPGQQIGMSGSERGYHVHAEVQLPVGPGGSYTPVDPDLYYSGYYCDQGFCPS